MDSGGLSEDTQSLSETGERLESIWRAASNTVIRPLPNSVNENERPGSGRLRLPRSLAPTQKDAPSLRLEAGAVVETSICRLQHQTIHQQRVSVPKRRLCGAYRYLRMELKMDSFKEASLLVLSSAVDNPSPQQEEKRQ